MPNGAPAPNPVPGAIPLLPNQGRIIQTGPQRILCVADVRGKCSRSQDFQKHHLTIWPGNLASLNELAAQARADFIIHTGDFGFYDNNSLDRIAEKCVLTR